MRLNDSVPAEGSQKNASVSVVVSVPVWVRLVAVVTKVRSLAPAVNC